MKCSISRWGVALYSLSLSTGFGLAVPEHGHAQRPAPTHSDLVYGTVGERELLLDLYLPTSDVSVPLVVFVHGGAWQRGDKDGPLPLSDFGYAVASLDFRLSGEAPFPAQVHDIKAAIRFLRGEASRFGYSAEQIALAGASSGGHLAALVGLTAGDRGLEGDIGDYPTASSEVQAIVSYCGASNLTTILSQSTPHGLSVREPALDLFIGGQPSEVPDVARAASPVFYVDRTDPPLLLLHGDQDPQMPINQSHELFGAYERQGLDATFEVGYGAGHCSSELFTGELWTSLLQFLERTVGR